MKAIRLYLLIMLLLSFGGTWAQTSFEEIDANPAKAGGVYLTYPVEEYHQTPAPKGYQPFYISHYGRHGSRFLLRDKDYKWIIDLLKDADNQHALTDLGRDLLVKLQELWPIVEGRGGDLTSVGERQHRGIAYRMYTHYPEVFRKTKKVSARSTMSLRCAMSMAAFCDELKGFSPGLEMHLEASEKYVKYLNWQSKESNTFADDKHGPWVEEYRKFSLAQTRPERMCRSLFSDSIYVLKKVNPSELMWGLYWIIVDMQDIDTTIQLPQVLTNRELFNLWQVINYKFYVDGANHADGKGACPRKAVPLVKNIIESADEAIVNKNIAATLRFGHDGNIIPLLALIKLENFNASVSNPYEVYKVWSDFKAVPMAGNIQLIFYKNKKNDVLVKILHNEKEAHVALHTDIFPYYHWKELRSYLQSLL